MTKPVQVSQVGGKRDNHIRMPQADRQRDDHNTFSKQLDRWMQADRQRGTHAYTCQGQVNRGD